MGSGSESILHLHGLEDQESIALIDLLTDLDMDGNNFAWHRSMELLGVGDRALSSKNLAALERERRLDSEII